MASRKVKNSKQQLAVNSLEEIKELVNAKFSVTQD